MKIKIPQKVKCFFGFHTWELYYWSSKYGVIFGDKCKHCPRWHKDAIKHDYR